MKIDQPAMKQDLINRLRRIEGQLRGLQAMVSDERDCSDILQQMSATRSALKSATLDFMHSYAACLANQKQTLEPQERESIMQEFITLLGRSEN